MIIIYIYIYICIYLFSEVTSGCTPGGFSDLLLITVLIAYQWH